MPKRSKHTSKNKKPLQVNKEPAAPVFNGPLLNAPGAGIRLQIRQQTIATHGSVPSPAIMKEYSLVIPSAPERILKIARRNKTISFPSKKKFRAGLIGKSGGQNSFPSHSLLLWKS